MTDAWTEWTGRWMERHSDGQTDMEVEIVTLHVSKLDFLCGLYLENKYGHLHDLHPSILCYMLLGRKEAPNLC